MNLDISLLTMPNQIKIFHWQTHSYAQHMAFDIAYDELLDQIDKFVEVYQGKYGNIMLDEFSIELVNLGTPDATITGYIDWLTRELPNVLDATTDTDLLNIRDEMLATLNQLKYRLTLS